MQVCHECGYDNERGNGELKNCLNCNSSFEVTAKIKVKCSCSGICTSCGIVTCYSVNKPNPFASEILGDDSPDTLCESCYASACDDI